MSLRKSIPPEERFWPRVDASGDCWEWIGSRDKAGYGQFHPSKGVCAKAHRFAFEALVGAIPADKELDHLCRNRACVNPDHLQVVTHRENVLRGHSVIHRRRRQTRCLRGHPLSGANLGINTNGGGRYCRLCVSARRAEKRAARPPKAPKTHFRCGCPYSTENIWRSPDGLREVCRACNNRRRREHKARRRYA